MKKTESWWGNPIHKENIPLSISIIQDGDFWVASTNNETETLLGQQISSVAQGKSKEQAIAKLFEFIRIGNSHMEKQAISYERFVPFIKGDWKNKGGRWFTIFGFMFYFRYGKNNKYGWYVPFTKLNISFENKWKTYKNLYS